MNNDELQALKFEREKLADAKTKKAALLAALEASPEWKDAPSKWVQVKACTPKER